MDLWTWLQGTQNELASVSLTEDYINEMLEELVENDNVLFHLHRITEVEKALRTHCREDGGCLGAITDLDRVVEGSGELLSPSLLLSFPAISFTIRSPGQPTCSCSIPGNQKWWLCIRSPSTAHRTIVPKSGSPSSYTVSSPRNGGGIANSQTHCRPWCRRTLQVVCAIWDSRTQGELLFSAAANVELTPAGRTFHPPFHRNALSSRLTWPAVHTFPFHSTDVTHIPLKNWGKHCLQQRYLIACRRAKCTRISRRWRWSLATCRNYFSSTESSSKYVPL